MLVYPGPYRAPDLEDSSTMRNKLVRGDTGVPEHPHRQRERQPHHVGVVAPDPLDERRRPTLYSVPARLPHALPQPHVRLQLLLAERPHAYRGDGMPHRQPTRTRNSDPGVDL